MRASPVGRLCFAAAALLAVMVTAAVCHATTVNLALDVDGWENILTASGNDETPCCLPLTVGWPLPDTPDGKVTALAGVNGNGITINYANVWVADRFTLGIVTGTYSAGASALTRRATVWAKCTNPYSRGDFELWFFPNNERLKYFRAASILGGEEKPTWYRLDLASEQEFGWTAAELEALKVDVWGMHECPTGHTGGAFVIDYLKIWFET